ncbi:MAG: hypothetical protein QG632_812 [Candidatus Dependentiae bacterium]|nr:hypothetical protein [Candidatus Dependentiae bacterium]
MIIRRLRLFSLLLTIGLAANSLNTVAPSDLRTGLNILDTL